MKKHLAIEAVLLASLLALAGAQAEDNLVDQGAMDHARPAMAGMAHGDNDAHDKKLFTFGQPGDAKKVDRTIRIKALDTMRYDVRKLSVRAGETVRFIVTNTGRIRHEFMIGDATAQHEHEQEMQSMPGMVMSPAYLRRPVTLLGASMLRTSLPM